MKTRKQFSTKKVGSFATAKLLATMLCIIAALAIIGCKEDEPDPPPPPPQGLPDGTYNTASGTVKVTINNEALLSANTKSNLKAALTTVLAIANVTGNLTINVISGGTNGFIPAGSKTLSVGATWIDGKTEAAIGASIGGSLTDWIA